MATGRFDFNTDYKSVAASQTDSLLGTTGRKGDVLERLIINVATSATSTVSIKDGSGSAISVMSATAPVGTYSIEIGARCTDATTPGWRVTTGAGVSVIAVGQFS